MYLSKNLLHINFQDNFPVKFLWYGTCITSAVLKKVWICSESSQSISIEVNKNSNHIKLEIWLLILQGHLIIFTKVHVCSILNTNRGRFYETYNGQQSQATSHVGEEWNRGQFPSLSRHRDHKLDPIGFIQGSELCPIDIFEISWISEMYIPLISLFNYIGGGGK